MAPRNFNVAGSVAAVVLAALSLAACDEGATPEQRAKSLAEYEAEMAPPDELSKLPECNKAALRAMLQASAPDQVLVTNAIVGQASRKCDPASDFGRRYWSDAQARALAASAPQK